MRREERERKLMEPARMDIGAYRLLLKGWVTELEMHPQQAILRLPVDAALKRAFIRLKEDPEQIVMLLETLKHETWHPNLQPVVDQCGDRLAPPDILLPMLVSDVVVNTFFDFVHSEWDETDRKRLASVCAERGLHRGNIGSSVSSSPCPGPLVGPAIRATSKLFMNGAGLPCPSTKHHDFERWTTSCESPYPCLQHLFRIFWRRLWDPTQYKVYWTQGTTGAFKSVSRVKILRTTSAQLHGARGEGQVHFVAGSLQEYLPMVHHAESEFDSVWTIDVHTPLVDHLSSSLEKILSQAKQQGASIVVLLLATVSRLGHRLELLDHSCFDLWRERATASGLDLHIWLDASQDERVHSKADITFYSKRWGGSGGGIVIGSLAKYSKDWLDSVFGTQSGIRINVPAYICATMYTMSTSPSIALGIEEMLVHPQRWLSHASPEWPLLQDNLEGVRFFREDPLLSSLFHLKLDGQDDVPPEEIQPRANRRMVIFQLRFRAQQSAGHRLCETVRLMCGLEQLPGSPICALDSLLSHRKIAEVQNFSLRRYPKIRGIEDALLGGNVSSEKVSEIVKALRKFERKQASSLVHNLLPPELFSSTRTTLSDEQTLAFVRFLRESMEQHEVLRLSIGHHAWPGKLAFFFQRLRKALLDIGLNHSPALSNENSDRARSPGFMF